MRIAIATCQEMPEPDVDQEPFLAALGAAGLGADLVAWDAPGVDLSGYDACVLRSTWNYHERCDEFLAWLKATERVTRLRNPYDVVAWNVHKRYLLELESCGVPIVPTALVSRGANTRLESVLEARGWDDVVIKPAVSAGSFRTKRFRPGQVEAGEAFLRDLSGDLDTLVQRYEASVEDGGERALVWIAGEFTHAIAKAPRFTGDDESVSEAQPLGAEERELAQALVAPWADRLLYARVDVIVDGGGHPRLSELELIEPSLYLVQEPRAEKRLVEAIARLAASP